jgi:hypothetical protein
MTYKCATCGEQHNEVPLSFGADFPDMYANMKREERDVRAVIGSDQCIIDRQWFFLRGCLEIPIIGSDEVFLWGLWVSLREADFDEISDSWEEAGREKLHGPFNGRLANSFTVYSPTLNLKTQIIIQPVGARPLFVIEEQDHPLAMEQASGITRDRVTELVSLLMHPETRSLRSPTPAPE